MPSDNRAQPCEQQSRPRRAQFSMRSMMVAMLVVALGVGWFADRQISQARFRTQLQAEAERSAAADTRVRQFANWYAVEHSLVEIPDEHRNLVDPYFNPREGFRLMRLRNAQLPPAQAALHGKSFRVRGGPFQFELVAEDSSGPEPVTTFRLAGPEGDLASTNADGVFTYVWPALFKFVSGQRQPSEEAYVVTFGQQGSFKPISVSVTEVWPDWIYTAEGSKQVERTEVEGRAGIIPAGTPQTLFSEEWAAADGRKARVRLIVTCKPQVDKGSGE